MRYGYRITVAAGFLGAVAMAAAAFGQVGGETDLPPAPLQAEEGEGTDRRADGRERRHDACHERIRAADGDDEAGAEELHARCHRPRPHRAHRLVTSEAVLQTADGFVTVLTDVGTVTGVTHDTFTLTIERADGVTLTFTATEETRVREGRERAGFSDIGVGDTVRVMRTEGEDGTRVRFIHIRVTDRAAADEEPAPAALVG